MALVETYVDPDNSAGTDYTSLSAWEAGEQTNLVTAGDSHKVWCQSSDGTADTTAVDINGWTTGSSNTITIEGEGVEGEYVLATTQGIALKVSDSYTTVKSMIIGLSSSAYGYRRAFDIASDASYCTLSKSKVYVDTSPVHNHGVKVNGTYATIINNFIHCTQDKFDGLSILAGNSFAANNTIVGWSRGYYSGWNTPKATNNLSYNNDTDFTLGGGSWAAGTDYNFSKDDTAPGANSIHGDTDSKTPDFVSTTAGSEDFHLQSTSDAIGAGTDLSAYFTDDIDGDTRSNWDIGADEYVALATTALTNYYYTHLMQGGL